ncbi:hypothetical protein L218DRAFT_946527 [Marasmius fiardii PR-910]|nr:hypothetical protein L218DRAFT_946527 [Marasmius fiardii PR-910]
MPSFSTLTIYILAAITSASHVAPISAPTVHARSLLGGSKLSNLPTDFLFSLVPGQDQYGAGSYLPGSDSPHSGSGTDYVNDSSDYKTVNPSDNYEAANANDNEAAYANPGSNHEATDGNDSTDYEVVDAGDSTDHQGADGNDSNDYENTDANDSNNYENADASDSNDYENTDANDNDYEAAPNYEAANTPNYKGHNTIVYTRASSSCGPCAAKSIVSDAMGQLQPILQQLASLSATELTVNTLNPILAQVNGILGGLNVQFGALVDVNANDSKFSSVVDVTNAVSPLANAQEPWQLQRTKNNCFEVNFNANTPDSITTTLAERNFELVYTGGSNIGSGVESMGSRISGREEVDRLVASMWAVENG